ncbi:MAG: hypothetical protein LQ338_005867 [Usnochroma carphineum]|nr:MAG: hypothetical protein LQ338_005867 [Usnochroma carphineum]
MSNGSSPPASASALGGSIDTLWGAVRPFAVTLRDVIMLHSTSPIPSIDGTSTTSPLIPSVQSRRAACTHLTMERLYGDYECMVCQRPSAWGWVYSCTQDDSDEEASSTSNYNPSMAATMADLTPWIQEAICKGNYTEDQVEKLVAQRQKVIDTISASEAHFRKTEAVTRRTSSRKSRAPSTSIEANGHLPFPVFTELANSAADVARPSFDYSADSRPRIFPVCRYRACQLCRPTYRDRTWQTFENAFTAKVLPSDIYENDTNRPVSDPDVVRKLGVRRRKAPRPRLRTFERRGIYTINAEGRLTLRNGAASRPSDLSEVSADLADQTAEDDSKGFRDSVKRAFKGMLMSRRRESRSSKHSKRSSRQVKISEDGSAEFDLGLWNELSEELLREAAAVPLPGHDGKDGLEAEEDEVEVEDGVAVTEEAVDLGTADIIMSV